VILPAAVSAELMEDYVIPIARIATSYLRQVLSALLFTCLIVHL